MKILSPFYSTAITVLFLAGPAVGVGDCGCSSCTSSTLDKDADGHKVRDRIDWLIANAGQSEQEACTTGKSMLPGGVCKTCILVLCSQ